MGMMNMSMRFIILKSFMMKVSILANHHGSMCPISILILAATDTKEEDLIHPEDIEHFRKHDEQEAAAEHQEQLDRMPIVEQNIPRKFRRY